MPSPLERIAREAMVANGLEPDFPKSAKEQAAHLPPEDDQGRDLRDLPWSSIDNDDSRDLDQLEVCVEEERPAPAVDRHRRRGRAGAEGLADRSITPH
jgi:exoribonuclease-2